MGIACSTKKQSNRNKENQNDDPLKHKIPARRIPTSFNFNGVNLAKSKTHYKNVDNHQRHTPIK